MTTKPFNMDEVKPDLSNLRTRDGKRILDLHKYKVVAHTGTAMTTAIESNGVVYISNYKADGMVSGRNHPDDLVLIEEPKLIDWSKLPVDTLIETNEGLRYFKRAYGIEAIVPHYSGRTSLTAGGSEDGMCYAAKIIENNKFTVWQGGNNPVPEGVNVEVILRNGNRTDKQNSSSYFWGHEGVPGDIIAYRILGASDGYSPFFQGNELS